MEKFFSWLEKQKKQISMGYTQEHALYTVYI